LSFVRYDHGSILCTFSTEEFEYFTTASLQRPLFEGIPVGIPIVNEDPERIRSYGDFFSRKPSKKIPEKNGEVRAGKSVAGNHVEKIAKITGEWKFFFEVGIW
jgi:hypothetical protein